MKKKEFKRYKFNIHSHSIQALNKIYNFPVIDDNEMVRYFIMKMNLIISEYIYQKKII